MAVNAVPFQAHAKTASDSSGQKAGGNSGFSSIMNSVLPNFANALNSGNHALALADKAMERSTAASLGAEKAMERSTAASLSAEKATERRNAFTSDATATPQRTKEEAAVSSRNERKQNPENAVEKPAKNDQVASTENVRPEPEAKTEEKSEPEIEVGQAQPPLNEREIPEKGVPGIAEAVADVAALVAGPAGEIEKNANPVKGQTVQNSAPSNAKPAEAPIPANIPPANDAPELTEAAKAAIEQVKAAAPNAATDQTARLAAHKTDAISQQSAGLARAAGDQPVAISVETKTEIARASGTSPIPAQSASGLSPSATVTAAASQTAAQDSAKNPSFSTGEQPTQSQNQGQNAPDASRLASQQSANAASVAATITNRVAAVANNAQPAFSEVLGTVATATPTTAASIATTPIDAAAAGLASARPLPGVAQAAAANARTAVLPHTMEQIKVQIGKGLADGQDTIKMQLHPSELGRIEIRLEMRSGQVTATIIADRQETLQLLKNDSQALQQSLQDAGLDSNKNSLSFQLRSDNEQAERQSAEKGAEEDNRGVDIVEDVIQPKIAETMNDGALNITV